MFFALFASSYCKTQYNFDASTRIFTVTAENDADTIDESKIYELFDEGRNWSELVVKGPFKKIPKNAFRGAVNCTKVTLPDTIEGIDTGAFEQNSLLTEFTLPKGCLYVAAYAFMDCENLKTFTYYKRCTNFSSYVFKNAYYLESFVRAKDDDTTPGHPSSFFGDSMFYNCQSLQTVEFPENTVTLGDACFSGAMTLASITLPEGITTIPRECFEGCNQLVTVNLKNIEVVGYHSFAACMAMKELTFSEKLTLIGDGAFASMMALENIDSIIKNNNVEYGAGSFEECSSIKSFKISQKATEIPSYLFSGCSGLSEITMHDNIKTIGKSAFYGTSLTKITIPKNLEEIGSGAFSNTQKLTEFVIPEGCKNFAVENNFLYQKDGNKTIIANPQGKVIENLVIPSGFKKISSGAFAYNKFKTIEFKGEMVEIGDQAFANNAALSGLLKLPKGVKHFGCKCFYNCYALSAVEIPEGTLSLGQECFAKCSKLKSVSFPSSLTDLCEGCFESCKVLTAIDLKNTGTLGEKCFSKCYALSKVTLPENCRELPRFVFSYCSALNTIKLSSTFQVFHAFCFNKAGLTEIEIPETVTNIEVNAFSGTQLKSVIIKSANINVSAYAFSHTRYLKDVEFLGEVTIIGKSAFYNSTVSKIKFHADVKALDQDAFFTTYISEIIYCSTLAVYGEALANLKYSPKIYTTANYDGDKFAGAKVTAKDIKYCPPPRTPAPTPRTPTASPAPTDIPLSRLGKKNYAIIGCTIGGVILVVAVALIVLIPFIMKKKGWAKKETLTESLLTQTV